MIIHTLNGAMFLFALYYWEKSSLMKKNSNDNKLGVEEWKNEKLSRVILGLNFIIRPTTIIDWVPVLIKDIFTCSRHSFIKGFLINCFHGIVCLSIAIIIESLYFK